MSDTTKPWSEKGLSVDDRAHTIFMQIAPTYLMIKETLDAAIAQALADNAPKWISVKERLPEEDPEYIGYSVDILLYFADGDMAVGWYSIEGGRWGWENEETCPEVRFWRPLPAPPQEDTP